VGGPAFQLHSGQTLQWRTGLSGQFSEPLLWQLPDDTSDTFAGPQTLYLVLEAHLTPSGQARSAASPSLWKPRGSASTLHSPGWHFLESLFPILSPYLHSCAPSSGGLCPGVSRQQIALEKGKSAFGSLSLPQSYE
jgi:hypothetical protein